MVGVDKARARRGLPPRVIASKVSVMKKPPDKIDEGEAWLRRCFEYEATHEIAFASPRALLEARLIAAMDKARAGRSRVRRKRATHPTRGKK